MTINIEYETDIDIKLDYRDIITKVVEASVDYVSCPYEVEVNVTLTDNGSIHEINKEYRDVDRPTDVLSFPMLEYTEPAKFDDLEEEFELEPGSYFNPDTGELLLGDIVVSVEKVFEQAESYGHSTTREFAFLLAHSMMHLFGYDHMEEAEAKVMESKQEAVLDSLGITRESYEDGSDVDSFNVDYSRQGIELSDDLKRKLITDAKAAMKLAYAPYSNFKVGAAVLAESGKIYVGCNIENVSYGATNCAERTAIFKAVSEGECCIKAVAIASSSGEETFPCGVCRQVMCEFMEADGLIILSKEEGWSEYSLESLIPHGFNEF